MELILRFTRLDRDAPFDAPVPVTVHFDNSDSETFDFRNPLADADLTDLRWYIERYPLWPVGPDYDRAEALQARLPRLGRALFDAVFDRSATAMRLWERFDGRRDGAEPATVVVDTTEPRILRLPWELLADEGGYLFSKQPPVHVRRRMHRSRDLRVRPFQPPVRLLMVISRPAGAGFIDPRSSAAPLLDALDPLGDAVAVEFLRPPTLAALNARLRDRDAPPVHVVHFDGHGVYDPAVGLGFLLFEDDRQERHNVDAEQLGALLNECGIPLMVLDACQTATPDERNPFASVAARLIESGVGAIVAMNYSVLVETAKRLTGHFYYGLAQGKAVSAALDDARLQLLADSKRLTLHRPGNVEEIIHLQDWFVPALYSQEAVLRPFTPHPTLRSLPQGEGTPEKLSLAQGEVTALRPPLPGGERAGVRGVPRQPARAGFPPEPQYGFHGRARELLALERSFAAKSIVVLHGFGGQGKTSLAAHAAQWLVRTGLFGRAAFVSFESGAGLEVVLAELGNALVGDNFAIHQGDPVEAIARALADEPTLVVFDNVESILPNGDVPLPADALQSLLNAAAAWFPPLPVNRSPIHHSPINHSSRLLLTTRDPNLPHPAFQPGRGARRLELPGLDTADALEFAGTILQELSLPRPPRESLSRFMDFLGGHPLSIQLVLPALRDLPDVDRLIGEFDALLPGFTVGEGKARNQSLEVSLRFSLRRLGEEAQALLPRLAVFQGGALEGELLRITEIDQATWASLKPALANAALVRLEEIPGVTVPYVHFHPTLAPFLARDLPADQRAALETRYWQAYYQFAGYLYQNDSKAPHQVRALAARELPNLKAGLRLTLAAGALDEAVDFADSINLFLNVFGRWRERDEVMGLVEREIGRLVDWDGGEGKITKAEFTMESGRGERLLQMGRAGEAEGVFRALLGRLEAGAAYADEEAGYDRTLTLQSLGRCLRAQGQPTQAAAQYRAALGAAAALAQTEQVRRTSAVAHQDLADVLRDMGQYAAARQEYEASLDIKKDIGDDRGVAVTLGQLGTLALVQNDLAEARRRYLEALTVFRGMGEAQMEAVAWHQLGRVAQEGRDWDEAERCYKESLAIKERIGDLALAATTCNQLAIVAENAGRPAEAERWYRRAIELGEAIHYTGELGKWYSNLANLLLAQGRLDEAEEYARKGLAITETLDLSAEPWKDYALMAQIAERRGRPDEARRWRRKEQETFAAFAGSEARLPQWVGPVAQAVVAASSGNAEARAQVEGLFDQMSAGNWLIADAIKGIWAGERDVDVLTEGIDANSALIVRRILAMLDAPSPPTPSPSEGEGEPEAEGAPPEGQGLTLPQLLDLVERAARGDRELGGQLFEAMRGMASDPAAPPEMRALGKVLVSILVGERDPNLDGLPPQMASAVRGLLGRLRG